MPESEATPCASPRNPGFSADFPGIIRPVGIIEASRNRPGIGTRPDARPASPKTFLKNSDKEVNPQARRVS